jgi:hypothetical protein
MQQIIEMLKTMQAKADAHQAKMDAMHKMMMISIDANQAKADADSKAWRKMEACRNVWRKETMACQERTEAHRECANQLQLT